MIKKNNVTNSLIGYSSKNHDRLNSIKQKHIRSKTSIKATLLKVYITMSIIVCGAMCVAGIYFAKTGMQKVQSNLLDSKLESDIQMVGNLLYSNYGKLSLDKGELISQDKKSLREDKSLISQIKESTGDAITFFAKQPKGFERIATSIENQSEGSAIGTFLDDKGPAYESVSRGEAYVGFVDVLKEQYLAAYEPIMSNDGEIIGLFSVALPSNQVEELISSELKTTVMAFFVIFSVIIVIAIFCTYITAKAIVKPIEMATDYTYLLGQLDLTKEMPSMLMAQKNEVGILAHSLNDLRQSLSQVISNAHTLAAAVKTDAGKLQDTSQYVNRTTEEINQVVEQIAAGATHQAQNTQDGALRVEGLGQLLEDSRTHIKGLENSADNMEQLKNGGLALIESLATSSRCTMEDVKASYKSILEAKEKADTISQASEKIKAISNQTGLLALNAAIEAARTGEEGKGFAIIAMEIRKLSDQADKFTKEIEESIHDLGSTSIVAVNAMKKIKEAIEEQTKSISDATHKFYGIAGAIDETNGALEKVLEVEANMLENRDEIVGIMQTLSSIAEENAASTEEVASSIREQSESIEDVYLAAQRLNELAKEMEDGVACFKIE